MNVNLVATCKPPTFWWWARNIPGSFSQYHGCWCPGCLSRQAIGSHVIERITRRFLSSNRRDFNYACHFNSFPLSAAYMCQITGWALVQVMACRRQAITWTNADKLSIRLLGTNFSQIRIEIRKFSFMKMHLKMSSAKWRPFCPGRDEWKWGLDR